MGPTTFLPFIILVFLPLSLGVGTKQKTFQRYKINDNEWKRAQSIINKLVDESIANRVSEAEKDMTSLLEQNIEEHIKRKSKSYFAGIKKDCQDKIEHCDSLATAGVCKTSKRAMKEHCAKTCKLCQQEFIQIHPEVEIVMKPKKIKTANETSKKSENAVRPEVKAAALQKLYSKEETVIPGETISALHSIEPLLSQQSSVAMKYHNNEDMSTENEKIKDAQKLLEYVKVLKPAPKKKPAVAKTAAKKHTTKIVKTKKSFKKSQTKKLKGVPMDKLSKTVTYKNQKYKITPIVDWEKISKMLKSLGYKAVHIVGAKNKHLEKGLQDHLKQSGVTKVMTGKHKVHVAPETFVSATHRHKSWRNDKYFKEHCHPLCLVACIGSCGPGCCKEHDKVDAKTGLAKHCHPNCLTDCVPACGSGCCSADEEKKRGHKFTHFNKLKTLHKEKDAPKKKETPKKAEDKPKVSKVKEEKKKDFSLKDIGHKEKPHPPIVNPKLSSEDLYKPQPRLCPGSCPAVCAPACSDVCCGFGEFSSTYNGIPSHDSHPGLQPNIPYPKQNAIPGDAYMCDEKCKFNCDQSCSADCCQPEGVIARDARLQEGQYLYAPPPPQPAGYQPAIQTVEEPATCPSPCPNSCLPVCNVACCASALGLPQADSGVDSNAEARSSTRRVIHIKQVIHPLQRKQNVPKSCPAYCGAHCTPICARSGCCA